METASMRCWRFIASFWLACVTQIMPEGPASLQETVRSDAKQRCRERLMQP